MNTLLNEQLKRFFQDYIKATKMAKCLEDIYKESGQFLNVKTDVIIGKDGNPEIDMHITPVKPAEYIEVTFNVQKDGQQ